MITHNGKQVTLAMRNRKAINLIARNGKAMFGEFSAISWAAKAVILAEYGKQVWSDVRDYAKAHPQIVEFINQDPHLACSISTNSNKERWLVGDGVARLVIPYYPSNNTHITAEYMVDAFADDLGQSCTIFGSAEAWGKKAYEVLFPVNTLTRHNIAWGDTTPQWSLTTPLNTRLLVDWNKQSFLYKNLDSGAELLKTTLSAQTFTSPYHLGIFKSYRGEMNSTPTARIRAKYVKEESAFHLVPCTYDGQCGMLDLVSATFHPNANTQGTFTIAITDKE